MELKQSVDELWTHAIASKTRAMYNTGYSHFGRFLLLHGVNINIHKFPPVTEDILIYVVAHCFKVLQLKYTTIKLYLCGIRHVYLKSVYRNPLETSIGGLLPRLTMILNSAYTRSTK